MRRPWLAVLALAGLAACGGQGAAAAAKGPDLDADPLALIPASAVAVVSVDARALFDAPAVGAQVAALAERLVPLGAEAGFEARRDVDRVVLASFATTGVDVAAVLRGRFDDAKIAAVTEARDGGAIVKRMYAGHATYAAGRAVYAPLTEHTVLAGSSDGVRRVLDRIAAGKLERALPAWALQALETPGAEIAGEGDFATQPIAAAAIGSMRLPWLEGLRVARVVGNLDKPGLDVAATLTYGNPAQASSAADGVRAAASWVKLLGPLLGGVSLQDLDVKTEAADMQCKLAVDDKTLSNLLGLAPRLLPGP